MYVSYLCNHTRSFVSACLLSLHLRTCSFVGSLAVLLDVSGAALPRKVQRCEVGVLRRWLHFWQLSLLLIFCSSCITIFFKTISIAIHFWHLKVVLSNDAPVWSDGSRLQGWAERAFGSDSRELLQGPVGRDWMAWASCFRAFSSAPTALSLSVCAPSNTLGGALVGVFGEEI